MTYYLFAVGEEWQAEERRARRAEVERFCRTEEARALAGSTSTTDRLHSLRSWTARVLLRLAVALDARAMEVAPPAGAAHA